MFYGSEVKITLLVQNPRRAASRQLQAYFKVTASIFKLSIVCEVESFVFGR